MVSCKAIESTTRSFESIAFLFLFYYVLFGVEVYVGNQRLKWQAERAASKRRRQLAVGRWQMGAAFRQPATVA